MFLKELSFLYIYIRMVSVFSLSVISHSVDNFSQPFDQIFISKFFEIIRSR